MVVHDPAKKNPLKLMGLALVARSEGSLWLHQLREVNRRGDLQRREQDSSPEEIMLATRSELDTKNATYIVALHELTWEKLRVESHLQKPGSWRNQKSRKTDDQGHNSNPK